MRDKLKNFYQEHKNDIDINHVVAVGCMGAIFFLGRQSVGATALHLLDDGVSAAGFVELSNGKVVRPIVHLVQITK